MSDGAANWVRNQTSDMSNRCRSPASIASGFAIMSVSTDR